MWFFPYRLDVSLYQIPLLTILVCLICLGTFLSQIKSSKAFESNLSAYCEGEMEANLRAILNSIDDPHSGAGCANVFLSIRNAKDRDERIAELSGKVRGLEFYQKSDDDIRYKQSAIRDGFDTFESLVPPELTDKIAYQPDRYNVITMITSTFAHASWSHLIGNLIFFFVFASCVECALGSLNFALVFLTMSVVTSVAYSHSVSASDALPSIGLSGVAMGMMALLTTLLPRARIWCFFWFLFWIRRFTLPVLVITAWYIAWNVYDLNRHDTSSHINYMAHVSGAICGIVIGIFFRIATPARIDRLTTAMES
jgi:membrane associated rhomboid family serine protease